MLQQTTGLKDKHGLSPDLCPDAGQRPDISDLDYARAERYLPGNAAKLVFGLEMVPNWIGETDSFWYKVDTRSGKRFMLVRPEEMAQRDAFDHVRLAASLSLATGRGYTHENLPIETIEYSPDMGSLTLTLSDQAAWRCDLCNYEVTPCDGKPAPDHTVSKSPDGKWEAFCRDHDLFVKSTETGEEFRVTTDGQEGYHYARPLESPIVAAGLLTGEQAAPWLTPAISWSKDSMKFLTFKIDAREAGKCHLVQSVPLDGSKRPKLFSYIYPLPGDEKLPMAEPVIIDVEKKSLTRVAVEPVEFFYYGAPRLWGRWTDGARKDLLLVVRKRGSRVSTFYAVNPETGEARQLFVENAIAGGDVPEQHATDDGETIIWPSQRDGWTHLYRFDVPGPEHAGGNDPGPFQITHGNWVAREIKHVDAQSKTVYFTAGGKEPGIDPYYRLLYKVGFDGSNLQSLSVEDADHTVTFSPSGKYFVDTFSRVDLPPVTVLRSCDGTRHLELQKADVELLMETGWKPPERFCVKGRDGVTDVYGVIFRPSRFDPAKKYPLIEGNYSGPHTIRTPKTFAGGGQARWNYWQDTALAELGFIVVNADGLGMSFRSRAFLDYSFGNLGDGGFPDHIAAYRHLADKYPEMDLGKAGIYGASAGGYAACQAILAHPDFFKVAVVWAGNHDHRIDKASWVERYMGLYGPHYIDQANPTLAKNLRGKLLIMHGDMDENVPPASSLQLVDALIKANKDFDFLTVPNGVHASGRSPYVIRRRWDYFVRHLMGSEPPEGYLIREG